MPGPQNLKNKDRRFLLWSLILIAYLLIRLNLIDIPLDRDEGIFGYTGQVILGDGLPYQDVFDIKPPGVFYLNALALLFLPPTAAGIHLFLHIYNFITLIVVYLTAKSLSGSAPAGLCSAFIYGVLSSLPTVQGFTASTEMFLLLPLSISLLSAVLSKKGSRPHLSALVSGISGALAFWTKSTCIFILFFILLYLAAGRRPASNPNGPEPPKKTGPILSWLSGFLLITALICGYFLYKGVFDEFIYWSFTQSFHYAGSTGLAERLPAIGRRLVGIFDSSYIIVIAAAAACVSNILRRNKSGLFLPGYLLFSLACTLPGYAYPHYFAQIVPALAIAGGIGIYLWSESIKNRVRRSILMIAFSVLTLAPPLYAHSDYYFNNDPDIFCRRFFGVNPFPESREISGYLKERVGKGNTIFIFGSEPQILFYSGLRSCTPFAMIYPLTSNCPGHQEFQKQTLGDIIEGKPAYILIVDIPTSLLYDRRADRWIYEELTELIAENYHLEAFAAIDEPKGRVYQVSDFAGSEELEKALHYWRFKIYIYRINVGDPKFFPISPILSLNSG